MCKNSLTPSKGQILESWVLKKEKGPNKKDKEIFNKITTENFPKLENVLPSQVPETSRTPSGLH
jgi:hypothetical protein